MTPTPSLSSVEAWLAEATRDLPVHIAGVVRDELEAHYQDALEAHRQAGLDFNAAHQAALAELGCAGEVAAEMRATHLSRGRALLAMLASLGYPGLLMLMEPLARWLGDQAGYLVQDVLNTLVLVFILSTFVRLVGFNTARLERPAGLLMAAIFLGTLSRLAAMTLLGHLPLAGGEGLTWDTGTLAGVLIDIVFIGSEVMAALTSLWLGAGLYRSSEKMFGLLPTLSILLMLVCPIGLGVASSLLLGSILAAELFSLAGYLVVTTLLAVMIYIFYRTVFQRTPRPHLTA